VGRSPYQSEKRRKELARLKKQEEKRQRRFNKKHEGDAEGQQPESAEAVEGENPTATPDATGQAQPPEGSPEEQGSS